MCFASFRLISMEITLGILFKMGTELKEKYLDLLKKVFEGQCGCPSSGKSSAHVWESIPSSSCPLKPGAASPSLQGQRERDISAPRAMNMA